MPLFFLILFGLKDLYYFVSFAYEPIVELNIPFGESGSIILISKSERNSPDCIISDS